jgi:4-hydroxybenzoate polyprenyltransferase
VLRPYLELVRPPNVATALADVLAGFAIAGLGNLAALPWLAGASACLYAGGVALNDYADRAVDAVERPERPLPSGRVPPAHAAWLGGGLLVVGVGAATVATGAAGLVAAAIAGSVLLYDTWSKRSPVLGPLNMGLCRGLNLLLGVAAVPAALAPRWPVALIAVAYIAGVTTLSRGEVTGGRQRPTLVSLGLVGVALAGLAAVALAPGRHAWTGLAFLVLLAWRVLPPFLAVWKSPTPARIRHAVGRGVLSLVLLDAALAGAFAGPGYSLALVAAALAAGWLARMFEVT